MLREAPSDISAWLTPVVSVQALSECLVGIIASPTLLPDSEEVPFAPLTQRVMAGTVRVADGFGHREIVPEHLLVALLREQPGEAISCLRRLGVDIEQTVATVSKRLGDRRGPERQGCAV